MKAVAENFLVKGKQNVRCQELLLEGNCGVINLVLSRFYPF